MSNKNLIAAQRAKADEFYTRREDIAAELKYYPGAFVNKIIYAPTDDPDESEFFKYLAENFNALKLRGLFASFKPAPGSEKKSYAVKIWTAAAASQAAASSDVRNLKIPGLEIFALETGDFRSDECVKLRDECDVIITNPPFSLFSDFVSWIFEAGKEFLIIGNLNAAMYKPNFKLVKSGRVWLGVTMPAWFNAPHDYFTGGKILRWQDDGRFIRQGAMSRWYTNIQHEAKGGQVKPKPSLVKYDNYNALDIPFVRDIPADYPGVMGVPVSWLDGYQPGRSEYEILGFSGDVKGGTRINGKQTYKRIFIKRKSQARESQG